MPIDWVKLSEAIPYAGTAIIFGLFMVTVLREFGKQRKEQTQAQDLKDERRDKAYLDGMERRDKDWRDFLAAQQVLRGESWKDMAGEVRELSVLIGHSTALLREHDAWERGLLMSMQRGGRRASDPPAPPMEGTDA